MEDYELLYRAKKSDYLILKSILAGGFISKYCLTQESQQLLKEIESLRIENKHLLNHILCKFNKKTYEIIKFIRKKCCISNVKFKKNIVDTVFDDFIHNIDLVELEKKQKSSPVVVGKYLDDVMKQSSSNNVGNDIRLWFIGRDIIESVKNINLKKFYKYQTESNIFVPVNMVKNINEQHIVNEIIFHCDLVSNVTNYMNPNLSMKCPEFFLIPSDAKKYFQKKMITQYLLLNP